MGLRTLLKGFDFYCRERVLESWRLEWQEDNRSYRLECRTNMVERFLLCFVRDGEETRHNIFFLEGKSLVRVVYYCKETAKAGGEEEDYMFFGRYKKGAIHAYFIICRGCEDPKELC